MQQSKTIFVTGATGNQGAAVVRSLISKGFTVKALTRNPSSPAAQKLKSQQVEIVQGNLNNISAFSDHLKDLHGIFCVLTFKYGTDLEIKQGLELASLAKSYNVRHFLYSSVFGADLQTGIPHWESKLIIENHVKQINLPYSIIRPASLFENFLIPAVKKRIVQGKLDSPLPGDFLQPFISSSDIGEVSTMIFLRRDEYLGKVIPLIKEQISMEMAASIFSNVLGKEIRYQKMPMFLTRIIMGKNLYKMFKWIESNHDILLKDSMKVNVEFTNMLDLTHWIKLNFKIN
jgi:uncharacterized protein YbjT (DUF2867 family)